MDKQLHTERLGVPSREGTCRVFDLGMRFPQTNPELLALLGVAWMHTMTPEEIAEQRVSFVYGCLDGKATKDQVREAINRQYSPVVFR